MEECFRIDPPPKPVLQDGKSASGYIEASYKQIAAILELVDLVKTLVYLQSCIDTQIEVSTKFESFPLLPWLFVLWLTLEFIFFQGAFRAISIGKVNVEGSSLEEMFSKKVEKTIVKTASADTLQVDLSRADLKRVTVQFELIQVKGKLEEAIRRA